jgi:hypothetical protein
LDHVERGRPFVFYHSSLAVSDWYPSEKQGRVVATQIEYARNPINVGGLKAGEVGDQSVVLVAHDITRFSAFTPIQNPSPIAAAIVIASPCPRREPFLNQLTLTLPDAPLFKV